MQQGSFAEALAALTGNGAAPTIDIGLVDGKRIRLESWAMDGDCLVGHGAHGAHRYLIQPAHIVLVEILSQD